VTKSAWQKLRLAYAHVEADDDEYAVPAMVVAESNVFVDVALLPDSQQMRSRFTVVADGPGAKEALERMQARYNGKVRLSITHCHQFGSPGLSPVDVSGFRSILANSNASKPYADGARIPVLLINGSGRAREVLAFVVTPTDVRRVEIVVIPDASPMVLEALERAPIAVPSLPRQDLLDRIERDLGTEWQVRLARNKKKNAMALLLTAECGTEYVVELGPEWPGGKPKIMPRRRNGRPAEAVPPISFFDSGVFIAGLQAYVEARPEDLTGFNLSYATTEGSLPGVALVTTKGDSTELPADFPWLEALDWAAFARRRAELRPPSPQHEQADSASGDRPHSDSAAAAEVRS